METERRYYRVIGMGLNGAVCDTPERAWDSFYRNGRSEYGYAHHDDGTARAAHSARLAVATTRRAADAADISSTGGSVGRGRWWVEENTITGPAQIIYPY